MLAFARLAHLAVAVVTKRLQLIGKKTISRVKNDRKGKETCLWRLRLPLLLLLLLMRLPMLLWLLLWLLICHCCLWRGWHLLLLLFFKQKRKKKTFTFCFKHEKSVAKGPIPQSHSCGADLFIFKLNFFFNTEKVFLKAIRLFTGCIYRCGGGRFGGIIAAGLPPGWYRYIGTSICGIFGSWYRPYGGPWYICSIGCYIQSKTEY